MSSRRRCAGNRRRTTCRNPPKKMGQVFGSTSWRLAAQNDVTLRMLCEQRLSRTGQIPDASRWTIYRRTRTAVILCQLLCARSRTHRRHIFMDGASVPMPSGCCQVVVIFCAAPPSCHQQSIQEPTFQILSRPQISWFITHRKNQGLLVKLLIV